MKTLLLYTREPLDSAIYDPKLAYSMHIALKTESGYAALNHNSGVFFAKATENADGTLNSKTLRSPIAFKLADGGYGIMAVRTNEIGATDNESVGSVLVARTEDFISYTEIGLLKLSDSEIQAVSCKYCDSGKAYKVCYTTDASCKIFKLTDFDSLSGAAVDSCPGGCEVTVPEISCDIEGARPSCEIEVPDEIADRLVKKLTTPVNVEIRVPAETDVKCAGCVGRITATAVYSDGSTDEKRVDWDISGVDFSQSGKYEISGRVHQDHFEFPIATNRADPCVARWHGKYYFIATNDADGNHTLYIRCADSIPELVNAPETLLLDSNTYEDIGGLLWAPEFHEIDGRLYIFHAATSGEFFREESHIMELREGGDPMLRSDWSRPQRIVKADGSELCEAGKVITLDMTCFEWQGEYYVIWSQRQFLPVDQGAWLYIAKLNPDHPRRLLTEPVVLSKPDYGWANNHTFVDEGPFSLIRGDKLWISFSSAAVDSTYVVSFLSIDKGKDLLVRENWTKANFPAMTSRCVEGEFGTGHNAYVIDEDGKVWNTYHARPGIDAPRSSGIRRVHFNVYGEPVLDMTEEMDIKPELRDVKTVINVK